MKKSPITNTDIVVQRGSGSKNLVPALIAVGGGLAALPAAALELGDVKVNSSLGQPLRASIAYALGPNEAISDSCVSLGVPAPGSGLPAVSRGTIDVADGVISVVGRTVIREPLMSLRVNIRCPYTPHLSRDYMLFVDPAQPATSVEPAAAAAAPQPVASQPATPAIVRRRTVNREPIANATRYRVQPGDSLSQIAQRIEDRPVGLWEAVGAIFDANPSAFIDNDPNRLKAGSWLEIPDLGAGQPLTVADKVFPTATAEVAAEPAAAVTSESASSAGESATAYDPALTVANEPVVEPELVEPPADAAADAAESGLAGLEPGDVILDDSLITTGDDAVVIPDTALEGPEATSSSPNVPAATIQPTSPDSSGTNWFLWLIGGGIAIIVALLFGRSLRGRFGSTPVGATVALPQRRKSDTASHRMPPVDEHIEVQEITPLDAPEVTIDDDSPTEENLALDADLAIGTGLTEGTDVDFAQDFGFAATTDLDLELPEEMSSGQYEKPETDIIPPLNSDMESILESEVLPDTDEDEYDMSVIVDATKMPNPDDVTQRDLEAVEVPHDDTLITGDYTVSQEVDYKILEQDYEDEMTATQALNQEIARAAEELATRIDDMEADEDTSEMSLASVTALDVTAQLHANNDDGISELDDTGINEAVNTVNMDGDDKTVEMDSNEKTVELEGNEKTVEMPAKKASKR